MATIDALFDALYHLTLSFVGGSFFLLVLIAVVCWRGIRRGRRGDL